MIYNSIMDISKMAKEIERGYKHIEPDRGFGPASATETAKAIRKFIEGLEEEEAIDLLIVLHNRRCARNLIGRRSNK